MSIERLDMLFNISWNILQNNPLFEYNLDINLHCNHVLVVQSFKPSQFEEIESIIAYALSHQIEQTQTLPQTYCNLDYLLAHPIF